VPCFIDDHFRRGLKANDFRAREKFDCSFGTPRNYRDRGTDKNDICAIAAELRDAVNELRPANEAVERTFTSWDRRRAVLSFVDPK